MWDFETDEIGCIVATLNGHTHMYRFPREETDFAVQTVKRHVCEGQLHPYAGLVIANMMREFERE